jgi:hypothetical protein
MVEFCSHIWSDEKGQDIEEYAVMLAVCLGLPSPCKTTAFRCCPFVMPQSPTPSATTSGKFLRSKRHLHRFQTARRGPEFL